MSTQTTEALAQRMFELISANHDVPIEQISMNSQFVADFGFDSLEKVEFVMTVEEEFDIAVPDEVADTIITVQDAVHLIQKSIIAK